MYLTINIIPNYIVESIVGKILPFYFVNCVKYALPTQFFLLLSTFY